MPIRMIRWIKYEGEGIPKGIENIDWKMMPIGVNSEEYVIAIKVTDDTYSENSPEAIAIKSQIKDMNFRLTNIKCKICGSLMEKYLLTPHPKHNRLGWKSRIICSNEECLDEYYTKEDV